MSQYVPLTPEHHKNLKVTQFPDHSKFATYNLTPIAVHEFPALACEYVLAFVKNEQTGEFIAVAMTGIREGENLFCENNRWNSHFLPATVANEPFLLARKDNDGDNYFICIDQDSKSLSSTEGDALFNNNGERSEFLNARAQQLSQVEGRRAQTTDFIQTLKNLELLTPQSLRLNVGGDNTENINGLFLVDENKLTQLDDQAFLELKAKGYLAPIYSHLISLHQLNRLSAMYTQKHSAKG